MAEFEQLKKAAAAAHTNRSIGKQLEMKQFHSGGSIGLITNSQRVGFKAQPMGTIRGESTMGSDFDANNRTMSVASDQESTMRRDMASGM